VLVELDMQMMRLRFVLAREAIRMRELEHPDGGPQGIEDAPDTFGLEK